MNYQISEADSVDTLQRQVNQLIQEGWRPVGGVAVVQSQSSDKWWYYQAMIRGVSRPEAPDAGRPATLPPPRPTPLEEAVKVPPPRPRRPEGA